MELLLKIMTNNDLFFKLWFHIKEYYPYEQLEDNCILLDFNDYLYLDFNIFKWKY